MMEGSAHRAGPAGTAPAAAHEGQRAFPPGSAVFADRAGHRDRRLVEVTARPTAAKPRARPDCIFPPASAAPPPPPPAPVPVQLPPASGNHPAAAAVAASVADVARPATADRSWRGSARRPARPAAVDPAARADESADADTGTER